MISLLRHHDDEISPAFLLCIWVNNRYVTTYHDEGRSWMLDWYRVIRDVWRRAGTIMASRVAKSVVPYPVFTIKLHRPLHMPAVPAIQVLVNSTCTEDWT